jgi:hypothetical protein
VPLSERSVGLSRACEAGKAPNLYLEATYENTLDCVSFAILREYALFGKEADQVKDALDEKRDKVEKSF